MKNPASDDKRTKTAEKLRNLEEKLDADHCYSRNEDTSDIVRAMQIQ
jgi:hypothetical protein